MEKKLRTYVSHHQFLEHLKQNPHYNKLKLDWWVRIFKTKPIWVFKDTKRGRTSKDQEEAVHTTEELGCVCFCMLTSALLPRQSTHTPSFEYLTCPTRHSMDHCIHTQVGPAETSSAGKRTGRSPTPTPTQGSEKQTKELLRLLPWGLLDNPTCLANSSFNQL